MNTTATTTATASPLASRKRPAVARIPFSSEKVDFMGDFAARIEILEFISRRKSGKA